GAWSRPRGRAQRTSRPRSTGSRRGRAGDGAPLRESELPCLRGPLDEPSAARWKRQAFGGLGWTAPRISRVSPADHRRPDENGFALSRRVGPPPEAETLCHGRGDGRSVTGNRTIRREADQRMTAYIKGMREKQAKPELRSH